VNRASALMVIAAAVMVISALLGAGFARADGSMGDRSAVAYAAELDAVNIDGSSLTAATDLARIVCEKRAAGASEAQIIRVSEQQGSTRQATVVVLRAEFHFCPQYATSYRIGSGDAY